MDNGGIPANWSVTLPGQMSRDTAGTYSFRDRRPGARPGLYWVEAVSLDGTRTLVGPASAR